MWSCYHKSVSIHTEPRSFVFNKKTDRIGISTQNTERGENYLFNKIKHMLVILLPSCVVQKLKDSSVHQDI